MKYREIPVLSPEEEEEFWSRMERRGPDECWPWRFVRSTTPPDSYGGFTIRGTTYRTHRVAYTLRFGPIPSGLLICHSCDNPPCCNPDHLFPGGRFPNLDPGVAAQRVSVQLNYVIPDDVRADLDLYCERNYRNPSQVTLQLIDEYLTGDRDVERQETHPVGGRTSLRMRQHTLTALEKRTMDEGHKSKAALIAALLREFLEGRVDPASFVSVGPFPLPTPLFDKIMEADGPGDIESLVLKRLEASFETQKETA